jgi:hypothetical protein
MEIVGQGFNLPLYHSSIIRDSVDIYADWLLSPLTRPFYLQIIDSNSNQFQNFIQDIFMHSSMLFRIRKFHELQNPANPKQREVPEDYLQLAIFHIELCDKILNSFYTFVTNNSNILTLETWTVILKVLLGVCDTVLKYPALSNHPRQITNEFEAEDIGKLMGDKLSVLLIKVNLQLIKCLIEFWLLSPECSNEMWMLLKVYFLL